jgi:hypothetical protein
MMETVNESACKLLKGKKLITIRRLVTLLFMGTDDGDAKATDVPATCLTYVTDLAKPNWRLGNEETVIYEIRLLARATEENDS